MQQWHDIIQKSGSWFSYNGEKIGQGKENTKQFLESNPDLFAEIDAKVRAALFPAPAPKEA